MQMTMTPTFIRLAQEAAEKLNKTTSGVEIEGMGGYFTSHATTPLPQNAAVIADLKAEDGIAIVIYYL